jgi:anti-anti-sigma regulatory factor
MPFTFEESNSVGVLKLYGDFTARNASNVKKAFFVGLSNSEHLVMDLKGVSKIDDFFMDQIFSLKKISTKHKKRLTIINLHPGIFEKKEERNIDGDDREVSI